MECRNHVHGFLNLEGPQTMAALEAQKIVDMLVHVYLRGRRKDSGDIQRFQQILK